MRHVHQSTMKIRGGVRRVGPKITASTARLPRVELTSLLEDLRPHLADPGVPVYVPLLRAWVVSLAVRARRHWGGVTDNTKHHLYDRLRRCQHRASRDATGMHGGDGGIPRNRRRWVLPAALVVVGVLMMAIGASPQGDHASAGWVQLGSALFGPLYGAERMLERGSPSKSPRLFVVGHRRAGE
jgi:hypothetical protein